jgi:hypothetical protein
MFLKMKSTQLSHKTFFFLSFYIGFIIYLEVTQGHFYNLHILNIIKKKCQRVWMAQCCLGGACETVRPLNTAFRGCVWKVMMPFMCWSGAWTRQASSLASTTISIFLLSPKNYDQPLQFIFLHIWSMSF